MSVAEITQRIGEIESRLAMLAPQRATGTSAVAFASALSGASTVGTVLDATGAVTGDDVVRAAKSYEGVPYVLGGESRSGIDCSGLVQAAFGDLGVDVPRLVHEQQTIGQEVGSLAEAQPGDLVVLDGGNHIAIWAGDGTAVHAPYPGRNVSVQKAWFDDGDVVTIRRVVPAAAEATSGGSPSTTAQAGALLAMHGSGSSQTDVLSSMLGAGSGSTAQQLLAARAALSGTAA